MPLFQESEERAQGNASTIVAAVQQSFSFRPASAKKESAQQVVVQQGSTNSGKSSTRECRASLGSQFHEAAVGMKLTRQLVHSQRSVLAVFVVASSTSAAWKNEMINDTSLPFHVFCTIHLREVAQVMYSCYGLAASDCIAVCFSLYEQSIIVACFTAVAIRVTIYMHIHAQRAENAGSDK